MAARGRIYFTEITVFVSVASNTSVDGHVGHVVTRPLQHPGNHRYGWGLDRGTRRALGEPDPTMYPVPAQGASRPSTVDSLYH